MSQDNRENLYKILVVGDIGTGKSSILKKYVHGVFAEVYKSTIGVDFALKVVERNGKTYKLQLWDLAGQERYGNMTRVYYKEADAVVFVCDICRPTSVEGLDKWFSDIENKVSLPNGEPLPMVLIANKGDLLHDPSTVREAADFAVNHEIKPFTVSCKNDEFATKIYEPFNYLLDKIIANHAAGKYLKKEQIPVPPVVVPKKQTLPELWKEYNKVEMEFKNAMFAGRNNTDCIGLLKAIETAVLETLKPNNNVYDFEADLEHNIDVWQHGIELLNDCKERRCERIG